MERIHTNLFASHILTNDLAEEPTGAYDPTEQVWQDDSSVVAQECKPRYQTCSTNSDCCSDDCLQAPALGLGICV